MKIYKLVLIVLVIVGITYFVGAKFGSSVEYKQVEKEVVLDNLKAKINQLKGELVAGIKQCESGGYDESYGLITFDPHATNKKIEQASIGTYQWKKASVIYYYKSIYGKDITGKDAVLIALDDLKAGQLTTDVIFKTDNGLSNWLNCSKKNGSQQKLEVINTLLK